jgi:hypothetical protein
MFNYDDVNSLKNKEILNEPELRRIDSWNS